jgi:hypothetical protein
MGSKKITSKKLPTTLAQAWRKSITKWILLSMGYIAESQIDSCGLCNLFLDSDSHCLKCPVYRVTGQDGCEDTPYRLYYDRLKEGESEFTLSAYARVELNFLKAVRSNRGGVK